MGKKTEPTAKTLANKARRAARYGSQFNRKGTRAERRDAAFLARLRGEVAAPVLSDVEHAKQQAFFGAVSALASTATTPV